MSEAEPTPEVYEQPELTEELGSTALWELVESEEHRIWRRRWRKAYGSLMMKSE